VEKERYRALTVRMVPVVPLPPSWPPRQSQAHMGREGIVPERPTKTPALSRGEGQ